MENTGDANSMNADLLRTAQMLSEMLHKTDGSGHMDYENLLNAYRKAEKIMNVLHSGQPRNPLLPEQKNKHFLYMLQDVMPFIDDSLTKKFNAFVKFIELKGIMDTSYAPRQNASVPERRLGVLKALAPYFPEPHAQMIYTYIQLEEINMIMRGV